MKWLPLILFLPACFDFVARSEQATKQSPGDAPLLLGSTPQHGDIDVIDTTEIALLFTRPMQSASVTLTIEPAAQVEVARWSDDRLSVSFIVTEALAPATTYTVTVSGMDDDGTPMGALRDWSFTTRAAPANPRIVSFFPNDENGQVALDSPVRVTFTKPMAAVSVQATPNVELGEPTWSADKKTVTFPQAPPWQPATTYAVLVSATDTDARVLEGASAFSFDTFDPALTAPPTVVNVTPTNNATNVPRNSLVSVQFSKPMQPSSVVLTITPGACTLSWDASLTLCTCTPTSPLASQTTISVSISGAQDSLGLALNGASSFVFTTNNQTDSAPPVITATEPIISDPPPTHLSPNFTIALEFSKPMDAQATQNAFRLNGQAALGSFHWSQGGKRFVFTPAGAASLNQTISWSLDTSATAGGVALSAATTGVFKTFTRVTNHVLFGDAPLDGDIADDVYNPGTGVAYGGPEAWVGDLGERNSVRGFLSFRLVGDNALPANLMAINAATVSVYHVGVYHEPFAHPALGDVLLRSILFGDARTYETAWNAPEHLRQACSLCPVPIPMGCTLVTSTDGPGFKTCDVRTKVIRDWNDGANPNKHCQFRLQREQRDNNLDVDADYNRFYMTDVTTPSYRPYLTVSYDKPSAWP